MAFLAKQQIRDRISRGELIKDGSFRERNLHQASYDLSLGSEIYIVGESSPKRLKADEPYASLPPGQFAILISDEDVIIPNDILAFISIRSKFKFQGLVNISGFHVDPSFSGRLRFGVQNVGPSDVHLKFGEPTFTIFFAELSSMDIGNTRDQEKDIHFEQNLAGIRLEDVQLLGGSSLTLSALKKDVDRLETHLKILAPLAGAAFIGILFKLIHG
jgi:dCTP deaminase